MTQYCTYSGEFFQDAVLPLADRFGDTPRGRATLNHLTNHLTVPSRLGAVSTPHVSTHSEANHASRLFLVTYLFGAVQTGIMCSVVHAMHALSLDGGHCVALKGTTFWMAALFHSDRTRVRLALINCFLILP